MSHVPQPPPDEELRNIIDKLAVFVARNGPQFEQMTKQKQKDNPKFSFLFGGDYFPYYSYKVSAEQAIMKKQQSGPQNFAPGPPHHVMGNGTTHHGGMPLVPPNMPPVGPQIANLQNQLQQSEQNLKAQYDSLMQQKQAQITDAIEGEDYRIVQEDAKKEGLDLAEFSEKLQPLADSCTKEAISTAKSWFLANATSESRCSVILRFLLRKIKSAGVSFNNRLHILYLLNDLLHYSQRKESKILLDSLSYFVPQIFCHILELHSVDETQKEKLAKLMALWERNNYFEASVLEQLRNPAKTLAHSSVLKRERHATLVNQIFTSIDAQYKQYEGQHKDFCQHVQQQINMLKQQESMAQQHHQQGFPDAGGQRKARKSRFDTGCPTDQNMSIPPPGMTQPRQVFRQRPPLLPNAPTESPPPMSWNQRPRMNVPGPGFGVRPAPTPLFATNVPPPSSLTVEQVPLAVRTQGPLLTSTPPPVGPISEESLIPSVPYYDLPAALMIPLVNLEDCNYESLDPEKLRLPPPIPPSERLIAAVELFYSPPSHEHPRDSDGWEKLGLYEYFKAKERATAGKKIEVVPLTAEEKADKLVKAHQDKSGSSTPERKENKKRSRERGRSSRSRSRSYSPYRRPRRESNGRSRSRSRSGSRSKSKGSPSPEIAEPTTSILPPKDLTFSDSKLGEMNKGHQLLKKMGWTGKGLGAEESGIEEPVSAGEVRERSELYKGLGLSSTEEEDPFEQFRKNRAGQYIQRLRSAPSSSSSKRRR